MLVDEYPVIGGQKAAITSILKEKS